uniref:Uncharacterized protein n=1 Tax=Arundo donax TaxID=35708 RepID=A0A0A9EY30_ARUDO
MFSSVHADMRSQKPQRAVTVTTKQETQLPNYLLPYAIYIMSFIDDD